MKRNILYALFLGLIITACNDADLTTPGGQETESADIFIPEDAAEGELLVKFVPEMTEILDQVAAEAPAMTRSGIPSTDEVLRILGAYQLERVFPVDPRNEERAREAGLHLWYIVRFNPEADLKVAIGNLRLLGEVSKVQCNTQLKRVQRPNQKPVAVSSEQLRAMTRGTGHFNDPGLAQQWGYINHGSYDFEQEWAPTKAGSDVNCAEAWELCTGDPSIIVAVLDEGVMWSHPDLIANMWTNEAETVGADTDADGNGYRGDRYGYNFVKNSSVISWTSQFDTGHGTHVAGTIAAVNGNNEGVCGIAGGSNGEGGVKVMSCQIIDGASAVNLAQEARAIKYAADNGAVILQCSWGYNSALANIIMGYTPGPATEEEWANLYPLEKEALDYFIHNAGSPNGVIEGGIAIFASGNEYSAQAAFPAGYSKCVSVSAIAADFTPASYTNYGAELDFSAPGGDTEYYGAIGDSNSGLEMNNPNGSILSTLVINGQPSYGYYEGTSMACPHVSGVAALGLAYAVKQRRHFKAEEFIELMKAESSDLDSYYTGVKKYYYNHSTPGASLEQMQLSHYRGKMGRLINAGALLRAIGDGAGSEMRVPNVHVAPNESYAIDLSRYFVDGENLQYNVTGVDENIATAALQGTILVVRGLAEGTTTATIEAGEAKQTIAITVRKGNGNGWM